MRRLREWLNDTETTQIELARRMDVSQPTVSDWINDESKPSIDNLIKLSEITRLSIDALVRETDAA